MLLTRDEQQETLARAAQEIGLPVVKEDIDWTEGTVDSGGVSIHYLDWKNDGKPPLLLLHGGMQTAHSWDLIAVAMKGDYHVVAPDLRGHGDSDWPEGSQYAREAHAGDVEALIQHLGWERLTLIGLSLGGIASMTWAETGWPRLEKLVIVDVGPELKVPGVGKMVDFARSSTELDSLEEYVERAVAYNPRRSRDLLRYSLTHSVMQLPNGKWTWKYDRRIGGAGREALQGKEAANYFSSLWDALAKIACPVLVVRGADSEVFAEETGRKMVEVLQDGRFVTVPDASHTVAQDNAAGFLEAVRPFLSP
jgi:pimeloyl-ACP methyl ester carboxylesterase